MMETETQDYPDFHTYKSTFENLVNFPATEQSSEELINLINNVLKDQQVIVGLSQIPNKAKKNVDYILKAEKESIFSVPKKIESPVENNSKEETNAAIIKESDNHEEHSTEDKKIEQ